MRRPTATFALLLATASSVALIEGQALAADWIRTSSAPSDDPAAVVAERFVRGEGRSALRIGEAELTRSTELKAGRRATVRFEQRHRGVVVDGRGAAVQVDPAGRVRSAMVDVARDLAVDVTPALDAEQARDAAADQLPMDVGRLVRSQLVVIPRGTGQLAWRIDVTDSRGGARILVDALDGSLAGYRTLASHALGRVFEQNIEDTPDPIDVTLETLDTTASPIRLSGWDGLLEVANYVSGDQSSGYVAEQNLEPSSGEDFLYDLPEDLESVDDPFAQVNLFYHLTSHRTFFLDTLGVDATDDSWKVTAVANMREGGQPLDNAFFSPAGFESDDPDLVAPNMIGIGQGQIDFAYDADVFKHEFGHYVSHNAVGYNLGQLGSTTFGFSPHSGSVDEGIADYFACSVADDPILGEASLDELSAARDLEDTSKTCPDDMVGEVHADGEIVGSVGWTLRTALGREVADQLVWGAVSMMPSGGTLGDFASGVVETANGLVEDGVIDAADLTSVEEILAERGLDDCGSVITLDGEEPAHTFLIGLDVAAQAFGATCADLVTFGVEVQSIFHWSGQAEGEGATFHVDLEPIGGGNIQYRLLVRKDLPVGFGPPGPVGLPTPTLFDYEQDSDGNTLDLSIDASSDPPFDPEATYFAVLMSQNCPTADVDISFRSGATGEGGNGVGGSGEGGASTTAAGPGPSTGSTGPTTTASTGAGEGGGGSAAEDDEGCGCEVVGADAPGRGRWAALGAVAMVAAAAARRRRRAG